MTGRQSPSTPQPNRRGLATDARIHEAARQVLAERGLDLTIEDVAAAAGTTRMTVHRHVGTRQALLMDLVVEATDRLAEQLAVIFDGDEPFPDRVVEAFVYVVVTARSSPDRQAIALATTDPATSSGADGTPELGVPPTGWSAIDPEGRIMGEVLDFLVPRLAAGAQDHPFRAGVDETLAWLLRQVQLHLLVPSAYGDDVDALRHEARTFLLPAIFVSP